MCVIKDPEFNKLGQKGIRARARKQKGDEEEEVEAEVLWLDLRQMSGF